MDNFEKTFNFMKAKGFFKEYKSYDDWQKTKNVEILKREVALIEKKVDQFRETLPPEEQKQYDMAFCLGDYAEKVQKRVKVKPPKNEKLEK
jgi:hypothetical protein